MISASNDRKMYEDAIKLSDKELRKHALVSSQNRCGCSECFCCKCLSILKGKRNER